MNKFGLSFNHQGTHHPIPAHPVIHDITFLWTLLALCGAFLLMMKESVNSSYFWSINQASQQFSPELLASITDMGNGVVTGSLLVIILCFKPAWILRAILAAIICLVVTHLLKSYFDASRPAALLTQINIIGDARHSKSFPSGHTATIFLLAGIVFLSSKRRLSRVFFVSLATIVGLSRIAVGAHWPIDVALGAIIGWSSIYVAAYLCRESLLPKNTRLLILSALLLLLGSLSLINKNEFPHQPIVDSLQKLYLVSAALCLYISYMFNQRSSKVLFHNA
ncbi:MULTISPECIES: phosphatase PAP2 family protein [unclassified Shewanella]|uniref:phosphatase PAP2 family protein n=1 Tax=unclassified Shewanella TaxID=196818 RepID=UPI001C7CACAC|nr:MULTISPECIES: phosphatase PAP2 family protein [unclassified Shewanella]